MVGDALSSLDGSLSVNDIFVKGVGVSFFDLLFLLDIRLQEHVENVGVSITVVDGALGPNLLPVDDLAPLLGTF